MSNLQARVTRIIAQNRKIFPKVNLSQNSEQKEPVNVALVPEKSNEAGLERGNLNQHGRVTEYVLILEEPKKDDLAPEIPDAEATLSEKSPTKPLGLVSEKSMKDALVLEKLNDDVGLSTLKEQRKSTDSLFDLEKKQENTLALEKSKNSGLVFDQPQTYRLVLKIPILLTKDVVPKERKSRTLVLEKPMKCELVLEKPKKATTVSASQRKRTRVLKKPVKKFFIQAKQEKNTDLHELNRAPFGIPSSLVRNGSNDPTVCNNIIRESTKKCQPGEVELLIIVVLVAIIKSRNGCIVKWQTICCESVTSTG